MQDHESWRSLIPRRLILQAGFVHWLLGRWVQVDPYEKKSTFHLQPYIRYHYWLYSLAWRPGRFLIKRQVINVFVPFCILVIRAFIGCMQMGFISKTQNSYLRRQRGPRSTNNTKRTYTSQAFFLPLPPLPLPHFLIFLQLFYSHLPNIYIKTSFRRLALLRQDLQDDKKRKLVFEIQSI